MRNGVRIGNHLAAHFAELVQRKAQRAESDGVVQFALGNLRLVALLQRLFASQRRIDFLAGVSGLLTRLGDFLLQQLITRPRQLPPQ